MSRLRVLVVNEDSAELDRISNLLEKGSHVVLPLEKMAEAFEALGLQRFDAVLLPEHTPAEELATFASNLRRIEQDSRGGTRTSILLCSSCVTEPKMSANGQGTGFADAVLPDHFDPPQFAKTVEQLSLQLSRNGSASGVETNEELPVFDLQSFSELLGGSPELLDEIIGLYLDESRLQRRDMQDCMRTNNFDSLAKIAHTLKGSLGTLHAQRARARAEALEIAAIERKEEECRVNLQGLEAGLNELAPLLIRARSET